MFFLLHYIYFTTIEIAIHLDGCTQPTGKQTNVFSHQTWHAPRLHRIDRETLLCLSNTTCVCFFRWFLFVISLFFGRFMSFVLLLYPMYCCVWKGAMYIVFDSSCGLPRCLGAYFGFGTAICDQGHRLHSHNPVGDWENSAATLDEMICQCQFWVFFFWHDRFCNFLCNTSMGLRQQNLNLWLRRLIFVLLSANEMSISLQAVRTVMTSSSDAQGELDKDLRLMKAVWSAKLSPSLGNWVSCKKAQSLFHGNLRDAPKATPPKK